MHYTTSKLLTDHHSKVGPAEGLVFMMNGDTNISYKVETNMTRRAVVQRYDDVLTPTQVNEHGPEIEQTMMKELNLGPICNVSVAS